MSRAPDVSAERLKLAHCLGVEPTDLSMLDAVPADDLRTLRAQIGEALFQADKPHFARLAAVSKAVPVSVAAKLTELALPALLAARTAELLEPSKAVELVERLSDRYLADVSAVLDPLRSPVIIAAIPPARVVTINRELARRREWVVIGAYVSVIGSAALRACVADYDGEQLLRVGFVLDDQDKIDVIGEMLTDDQVDDMLAAALHHELWDELADQLEHLSGDHLDRLAHRFAHADDEVREGLREATVDGRLDAAALALIDR